MGDGDDVVAQPEGEEQLGGVGHEADDPHCRQAWHPVTNGKRADGASSTTVCGASAASLHGRSGSCQTTLLEVAAHTPPRDDGAAAVLHGAADRAERVLRRWASTRSSARGAPAGGAQGRGRPRRRARAEAGRRDRRLHLGRPGRDHHDLDRHRRARRAGAGQPARAALRRAAEPRDLRRCLGDRRLPAHHQRAHRRRRDRPQALRHRQGRGRRAAPGAAAALLPPPLHAVHRRPHRDQRPDPARARRRPRRDRAGGRHARGAQGAHRRVLHRRQARPRRGRDAARASSTCTSRTPAR